MSASGSLVPSVESEGKIVLKISGSLKKDCLEALSAGIAQAKVLIQEQAKTCNNQVKILVDLSDFDGSYDTISMEHLAELARFDTSYVYRTACFGGPILTGMLVQFVATLAGRSNLKFFASKDRAEDWLG